MPYFILYLALAATLMVSYLPAQAQEINAVVTVQTPKLQLVDPRTFRVLENDLREFINGRKWTDDSFKPEERVQCSFLITIMEELSTSRFKAQITVQSNRPVYNSSYNTVLFNFQDKSLEFEYVESQAIDFNENTYLNELSAVVGYYVYLILGMDYDSFSPQGGTPYFMRAQQIINSAQNKSPDKSWVPQGVTRNRYWTIENLLSNKFKNYRQATYTYHRLGLDEMYADPNAARTAIANAIAMVEKARADNPTSILSEIFVNAKGDEIVSIFADKQVPPPDKMKAYNSMMALDAANKSTYDKINSSLKDASPSNMAKNANQNGMPDMGMPGGGFDRFGKGQ